MYQARLLGAADHLDLDAGLAADSPEEVPLVVGLADGTGGDRADLCAVGIGNALHLPQSGNAAFHGLGLEVVHPLDPLTEANDLLL